MCGIAGIHVLNPENAPKWIKIEGAVDQLFAAIDHRGGDATGFVAVSDEETVWQKASCGASDFYKERRNVPWNVRSILLHTRMATQGLAAFPENNHPVKRGNVYVVHNGHIWNDVEIFRKTKRDRYGQVDSEAIAAIISKYGIMNTHKAMEQISGAAAIGVVDEMRPGNMVLARGSSSPLMFYSNENMAVFASTKDAVKRAWEVLYGTSPRMGKIEDVDEGTALYLLNDTISREKFTPDDYFAYTSYAKGYSYSDSKSRFDEYDDEKKLYEDELDDNEPRVTFVTSDGTKILCAHGAIWDNCEVCNPDDYEGSYLPARITAFDPIRNGQWVDGEFIAFDNDPGYTDELRKKKPSNDWVNADQCELCGYWFGEDELVNVQDIEDKWLFCKTCCEEMSDVIDSCNITKPVRFNSIHDLPLSVEI